MADVSYGTLPFSEQIAFFRSKNDVLTESWTDLWEAEHDLGFMVAGANRVDLLADFRQAIDKVVADGMTLAQFRKEFDRIVATYGWDYTGGRNWRSRVIYETNLRQSYNAGEWKQLQQVKRARPYWMYVHSDAVEHPRPLHLAWDGLVLSADDPWWHTHFPANGWGCQCSVRALNERDLRRLGKAAPDSPPPMDWQEVQVGQRGPGGPQAVRVPAGIDPGFAYAPGRSLDDGSVPAGGGPDIPPSLRGQMERSAQTMLEKTLRLPAATASTVVDEVLERPGVQTVIESGFAGWHTLLSSMGDAAPASHYFVGLLGTTVVAAASAAGHAVPAAAIAVQATDLDTMTPAALAAWTMLPSLLRSPQAVLLDRATNTLLYLARDDGTWLAATIVADADGKPLRVRAIGDVVLDGLRQQWDSGTLALLQGSLDI